MTSLFVVGDMDFGGVLVVDKDILEPDVLHVMDLPLMEGPVQWVAQGIASVEASAGAKTQRHLGVKSSAV